MSRSKGDGPGFRHFKRCPSLNCDRCVNGRAKKPFRRATRRNKRRDIQYQIAAHDLLITGNQSWFSR